MNDCFMSQTDFSVKLASEVSKAVYIPFGYAMYLHLAISSHVYEDNFLVVKDKKTGEGIKFSLNRLYRMYSDGISFEKIAKQVSESINKVYEERKKKRKLFRSIRKHIYAHLYDFDPERLPDNNCICFIKGENLGVLYIKINEKVSIPVTKDFLKYWGVTKEEVCEEIVSCPDIVF